MLELIPVLNIVGYSTENSKKLIALNPSYHIKYSYWTIFKNFSDFDI